MLYFEVPYWNIYLEAHYYRLALFLGAKKQNLYCLQGNTLFTQVMAWHIVWLYSCPCTMISLRAGIISILLTFVCHDTCMTWISGHWLAQWIYTEYTDKEIEEQFSCSSNVMCSKKPACLPIWVRPLLEFQTTLFFSFVPFLQFLHWYVCSLSVFVTRLSALWGQELILFFSAL